MSLKASQIKHDQNTALLPSLLDSLLQSVQMPIILISLNIAIIYLLSCLNQKTWSRSWQFTLRWHPLPSPSISNHYQVLILNSKIDVGSVHFSLVETLPVSLLSHHHLSLNCCGGSTPLPLPGCSPSHLLCARTLLLSVLCCPTTPLCFSFSHWSHWFFFPHLYPPVLLFPSPFSLLNLSLFCSHVSRPAAGDLVKLWITLCLSFG